MSELKFAVNDATAVRDILRDEFGYRKDRIRFLENEQATTGNIRKIFEEWLPSRNLQENDAVLVFFAGHGTLDGYLAGFDSQDDNRAETCMSVNWLKDCLKALKCRHKVIILDSCYSGEMFRQLPTLPPAERKSLSKSTDTRGNRVIGRGGDPTAGVHSLQYLLSRPAFLGLSAARSTPAVDGTSNGEHSVFTTQLLQVLRERANSPREDHLFTFRDVASQVRSRVANDSDSRQIPEWGYLGPGDGDFIFRPLFTSRRRTPNEKSSLRQQKVEAGKFNTELLQIQSTWQDNPHQALTTLENPHRFPTQLRDFSWRLLYCQIKRNLTKIKTNMHILDHRDKERNSSVSSVAFSSDGSVMCTCACGESHSVFIWDVATRRLELLWKGHKWPITCVAVSPDGKLAASVSSAASAYVPDVSIEQRQTMPGELILWDIAKKTRHLKLQGHERGINHVAFSPSGKFLATASNDKTIKIWNSGTLEEERTLEGHQKDVTSLAYSPNGTILYSTSDDSTIKVWNVDTGNLKTTLHDPDSSEILCIAISPDGRLIATGNSEGNVHIWDTNTKEVASIIERFVGAYVNCVSFSNDGEYLAIGGNGRVVRVWDVRREKLNRTHVHEKSYWMAVKCVAFSPKNNLLASGDNNGELRLWSTHESYSTDVLVGHYDIVKTISYSSDSRLIASGSLDGSVKIWNVRSGKLQKTLQHEALKNGVSIVLFSPDGRYLGIGGYGGIVVWDSLHWREQWASTEIFIVQDLAFSNDGSTLACVNHLGRHVRMFDSESGKVLKSFKSTDNRIAISPDNRWLATASTISHSVEIWDYKARKLERRFSLDIETEGKLSDNGFDSITFSPDGSSLATVNNQEGLIWDFSTGKIQTVFNGDGMICYSPDGKTLASCAGMHDALTGGKRLRFDGHSRGYIEAVAFSRDGGSFATASSDRTVRIRRATTAPQCAMVRAKSGRTGFTSMSVSADGKSIATDEYGTVTVWSVDSGHKTTEFEISRFPLILEYSSKKSFLLAVGHSGDFSAREAGCVQLWDILQRKKIGIVSKQIVEVLSEEIVQKIAFSTDNTIIASGWSGGEVSLWNTKTHKEIQKFDAGFKVLALDFSDDGQLLAVGGRSKKVILWDVRAGRKINALGGGLFGRGHQNSIIAVKFLQNNELLATGSLDKSVKLWDVQTQKVLRTMRGGDSIVTSLCVSGDDRYLISGDMNGGVHIWDVETGTKKGTLDRHEKRITGLEFSPDGKILFSSSEDETLRMWNWESVEEWIDFRKISGLHKFDPASFTKSSR